MQAKPTHSVHYFHPTILREYDIRGIVGETLFPEDAYVLGKAFGTYATQRSGNRICVGYDGRLTSPELAENLIKGLIEVGCKVKNIGIGPTPHVYFGVKDRQFDAGIMITGSHNPSEYNGFKMTLQRAPVFGKDILEIAKIAQDNAFLSPGNEGEETQLDIKDTYVDRLLKDFTGQAPIKIAWDPGNGAAGEILRKLVAKLPGEHILINDEIDGTFPNHHPDPSVDENVAELRQIVLDQKCDAGIAFDGDADRIGVIDEKGTILRSDILMTIYARAVLEKHPNAPIIGDVKCSSLMFDDITRMGGKAVMWKTGHSLIKSKMAELNAPLAGELSGHIFFADTYYGFDDALYCAIRLMNEISKEGVSLSSLTEHLPNIESTPEIRIKVDESKKFDIVQQIQDKTLSSYGDHKEIDVNTIDGARVNTPDGWWLLRASNTQNALVARVESSSPQGLDRLKQMLNNALSPFNLKV